MLQQCFSIKPNKIFIKALRQTPPWQRLVRNPPSVLQCRPGRGGCLVPTAVPARWLGGDHANWALASKFDGNIGVGQPPPADRLHGWPCSNHPFEHRGPPRLTRCRSCQPPPLLYLSRCEGSSRVASCHRHWACRWHDRGPTKRKMPLASPYHGRRPASLQSLCKTYPQSKGHNARNEQGWCTKDMDSRSEIQICYPYFRAVMFHSFQMQSLMEHAEHADIVAVFFPQLKNVKPIYYMGAQLRKIISLDMDDFGIFSHEKL